jgi:hypothetical protein
MAQRGTVEVIDKGGWIRSFPLNKNIIHIGSDLRNDIVIETWHGTGLAARHLQLVPSPTSSLGYRLVNMGTIEVLLGSNGERSLPPRAAIDLADGDNVRLGELTFIFHSEGAPLAVAGTAVAAAQSTAANRTATAAVTGMATAAAVAARKGNPIGLNLTLSQTLLAPGQPIDGAITIKNQGDKTGVQFKIEVEGFDSDSYELGPAPILFPDVEKQVLFRLRHPQKPNPPAGDRRLTIRVTAPNAYPGEVATVSQVIQVAPYIKHSVSLEFT